MSALRVRALGLLLFGCACSTVLGLEPAADRPTIHGAGAAGFSGNDTAGASGAGVGGAGAGGVGTAGAGVGGGSSGSAGNAGSAGSAGNGGSAGNAGSAGVAGDNGHPSCTGLSPSCNGEGCCLSPTVDGCSGCNFPDGHTATITPFQLDKYETTVGRFRQFVSAYQGPPSAGAGQHPQIPGTGWQAAWSAQLPATSAAYYSNLDNRSGAGSCMDRGMWTAAPGANENKPMNCVSWYEAFAFCIWDGGYLPTEMEWQFAAADGTQGRMYPWLGSTIDGNLALYGYCAMGVSTACDATVIQPVGSRPAGLGAFGQQDLAGSMWEWIFDYDGGVFPPADPCNDCADNVASQARMIRGGSWAEGANLQTTYYRNSNDDPASLWYNVGVRCARP